jgi:hypothetical protein
MRLWKHTPPLLPAREAEMGQFKDLQDLKAAKMDWRAIMNSIRVFHGLPSEASDVDILRVCDHMHRDTKPFLTDEELEAYVLKVRAGDYDVWAVRPLLAGTAHRLVA